LKRASGAGPGLACGLALLLSGCASAPSVDLQTEQPLASSTVPGNSIPQATSTPLREVPPPFPAAVDLQGQLSIKLLAFGKLPTHGISAGFFFSGRPEAGQLDLMTPLGSQLAHVLWSPEGAWVQRTGNGTIGRATHPTESQIGSLPVAPATPGNSVEGFDSIEELSKSLLGEAIPLRTLVHWMQGSPDPKRPRTDGPDAGLAVGTFAQDGWLIDVREWPRLLLVTRNPSEYLRGIIIKIYLDH
jgi:outer membrane lipoprotein LolB